MAIDRGVLIPFYIHLVKDISILVILVILKSSDCSIVAKEKKNSPLRTWLVIVTCPFKIFFFLKKNRRNEKVCALQKAEDLQACYARCAAYQCITPVAFFFLGQAVRIPFSFSTRNAQT
jgi:hypothetical protein